MKIVIIAGGTFVDIRPHFSLSAPAFGTVGVDLFAAMVEAEGARRDRLHIPRDRPLAGEPKICNVFTDMAADKYEYVSPESATRGKALVLDAGLSRLRTNEDLEKFLTHLRERDDVHAVVMAAAVCDFEPRFLSENVLVRNTFIVDHDHTPDGFGKEAPRLHTSNPDGSVREYDLRINPTKKLIGLIRRGEGARKDIFVVGFKTTTGATEDEQYIAGLSMMKSNSLNLVLANDLTTKVNMVITPEEARYHVGDRASALEGLAEMTLSRSNLRFTRSEVVGSESDLVPWDDARVPENLREVVDWCIAQGAYKPFRGKTVGHFAVRLANNEFLTSLRGTNFNVDLQKRGLARVITVGDDKVIAFGAKPSVGGQSQRSVFNDHPDTDCIVHFHCPPRPEASVNLAEQRLLECGSHECGENTSKNLRDYGNGIKAVMLDNHGPNIVFSRDVPAASVISFIQQNFDLSAKTGGPVELS